MSQAPLESPFVCLLWAHRVQGRTPTGLSQTLPLQGWVCKTPLSFGHSLALST